MNEPKFKEFADTIESVEDLPISFSAVGEEIRSDVVKFIKEVASEPETFNFSSEEVIFMLEYQMAEFNLVNTNLLTFNQYVRFREKKTALEILTNEIITFITKGV